MQKARRELITPLIVREANPCEEERTEGLGNKTNWDRNVPTIKPRRHYHQSLT